jgi:hypothetical protein
MALGRARHRVEAYEIEREPLLDEPSAPTMVGYVDAQDDDATEDEAGTEPDADVEDVVVARTATATAFQKRISKRTTGYTAKEDVCLCRSWHAISHDSICGAEQKGKAY